MSALPTDVVKDFLQNTAPDKVEAAARRLVADDATYISLNFDNPELKKILPWTGTSKGQRPFIDTGTRVAGYWTIEEFNVTELFGAGENVAVFGSFRYRSVSLGKVVTSPFSIHAKVRDAKIVYFQFMEDTFASARSFSKKGKWTIKTDPNGPEFDADFPPVARAVHKRSRRASGAFIGVNCAAIPPSLVASELFGHEKGAFTGASQRRLGRFEAADGGTIFLDEIGELPPEAQVSLLRVLQEREIERVGSSHPIAVDVRVVAATNRDLEAAVERGTFREDLFYRLNVFPVRLPPLRERAEDIPILVEYLVDRFAKQAGKTIRNIQKQTMQRLTAYDWPGNVRELQNVIERAVVLSEGGGETFVIDESWLARKQRTPSNGTAVTTLADGEKALIEAALQETHGRVAGPRGAAAKLGLPRQTLEWKIRNLNIDKFAFRRPTVT